MSKLVVILADGTTLDVPLKRERMTIGRRADNDICLPNLAVSGEHAAIVTILADSFLEDLGSTNGTRVNGAVVTKYFLRDGDQIDIGRHLMIYCVDEDAVLAPVAAPGRAKGAAIGRGERVEAAKPFARARREGQAGSYRGDAAAASGAGLRPPAPEHGPETTPPNAVAPTPRPPPPPRTASFKVLAGPGAGRAIPITKARTTLGRAGVQVALLVRTGETYTLSLVEGERAPLVNGATATAETALAPGDVIEIAGARLEFVGRPPAPEPR